MKNKAVAPLQISAEQILLEAFERKEEPLRVEKQTVVDLEELHEYQGRKRKEFEDALRVKRIDIGQWQRYALWEVEQKEMDRARSIFERALDVDPTHVPLWIKYIQTELKERNINYARNVLDRAVTVLPRVDKLWFTYISVEETLDNVAGTRAVFERWLKWRPGSAAWHAYIAMERRYGEIQRARDLFSRFTAVLPQVDNWLKWARFEEEEGSVENTRDVYTLAVDTTNEQNTIDEKLFIAWAKWESRQKEWERARAIYKFALELLSKDKTKKLYDNYSRFEKQFGEKAGVEDIILTKRKTEYEKQLENDSCNYDTWFSYLTLMEEASKNPADIRAIYERAVAQVPENHEHKSGWRRYVFLWIKYAIYEELTMNDLERTEKVYSRAVNTIPHKSFTFTKLWILYAKFEIRRGNIAKARKILGIAIGKSQGGKPSLFKQYIELEIKLKEFDNCRKLYNKYLETHYNLPDPWIDYATLEKDLGEYERARAIFDLAVSQPEIELAELLWKRYIDFETEIGRYSKARDLYRQLADKMDQAKVWASFAIFEISVPDKDASDDDDEDEDDEDDEATDAAKERARSVFRDAWNTLKQRGLKQERAALNEVWIEFEETHGDENSLKKVKEQSPSVVKKRTRLDDGTWKEYWDYVFPTDEGSKNYAKLLENAAKWKKAQQNAQ